MSAKTTNLNNYRGALVGDHEFGWLRSMFYEGTPSNPIRRPRMVLRPSRVTKTETPATVDAARGEVGLHDNATNKRIEAQVQ